MRNAALVDAGPLVAMIDRDDNHHAACNAAFKGFTLPLATVWPALSEAVFLLERISSSASQSLLEVIESGAIRLLELKSEDIPRIRELMAKYNDLPMDLADAAIVSAAERENIETIFTIDRRDFSLYRPRHVKQFKLLP